jgi:hypothetical protein
MDQVERRRAKAQLVANMAEGQSWREAAAEVGLVLSRSAAYRLAQRARREGATALEDHRHGHPSKLTAPGRQWLVATCRATPQASLDGCFRRPWRHTVAARSALDISMRSVPSGTCAAQRGARKKIGPAPHLNPPGKRAREVCSCWRQRRRQASSLRWSRRCTRQRQLLSGWHAAPRRRAANRS